MPIVLGREVLQQVRVDLAINAQGQAYRLRGAFESAAQRGKLKLADAEHTAQLAPPFTLADAINQGPHLWVVACDYFERLRRSQASPLAFDLFGWVAIAGPMFVDDGAIVVRHQLDSFKLHPLACAVDGVRVAGQDTLDTALNPFSPIGPTKGMHHRRTQQIVCVPSAFASIQCCRRVEVAAAVACFEFACFQRGKIEGRGFGIHMIMRRTGFFRTRCPNFFEWRIGLVEGEVVVMTGLLWSITTIRRSSGAPVLSFTVVGMSYPWLVHSRPERPQKAKTCTGDTAHMDALARHFSAQR